MLHWGKSQSQPFHLCSAAILQSSRLEVISKLVDNPEQPKTTFLTSLFPMKCILKNIPTINNTSDRVKHKTEGEDSVLLRQLPTISSCSLCCPIRAMQKSQLKNGFNTFQILIALKRHMEHLLKSRNLLGATGILSFNHTQYTNSHYANISCWITSLSVLSLAPYYIYWIIHQPKNGKQSTLH